MVSFALAGVFGTIGFMQDRRRWLALVVGSVAIWFLLVMLLWHGFA